MGKLQAEPWLVNAVLSGDLTVGELWVQYHTLGGERTRQELQIYLNGESAWDEADYRLLTQALGVPRSH
jgi:hypothetical protein